MSQTGKVRRNEVRMLYRKGLRRAKAVADYLLLSAPQHHLEATQFVVKLEQKYPDKSDIRKTREYREWEKKQVSRLTINNNPNHISPGIPIQKTQHSDISGNQIPSVKPEQSLQHTENQQKEFTLQIPLIHINTNSQDIPTASDTNTKAQDIPAASDIPTEEGQMFNIFNQIQPHVMNEILEEIRADPILNDIMNQLDVQEEVIDEGDICDIELNIDIGSPLEDELNSML